MSAGGGIPERRPGVWLMAAALALSLHAGGIALALRSSDPPQPDDEDSGVLMVELAPAAAAAPALEQPLPPGPVSSDAAESPAVAAQTTEVKPPPVEEQVSLPVAAEPPPELALPRQVAEPEPEKEPEKVVEEKQAAPASAASVASLATAPPPIEAPVADKPAAPVLGLSPRDRQARERWESALSGHLARFGRFPDGVRGLKEERIVTVRFELDRGGRVVSTAVASSSGSDPLDSEAQAMIRRASPLPVPPVQVAGERVELVVPVKFKVRR